MRDQKRHPLIGMPAIFHFLMGRWGRKQNPNKRTCRFCSSFFLLLFQCRRRFSYNFAECLFFGSRSIFVPEVKKLKIKNGLLVDFSKSSFLLQVRHATTRNPHMNLTKYATKSFMCRNPKLNCNNAKRRGKNTVLH